MCHGVFDVVHPGHVRHLVYAKTKADILIVSITADKFIKRNLQTSCTRKTKSIKFSSL